jgi:Leucine-rich repeat (LRR) protein
LERICNLSSNLEELYCNHNRLTFIDKLPKGLINLSCGDNLLSELPQLNKSIHNIFCSNNQLKSLENLPDSLEIISAFDNRIGVLSNIPIRCKFMILNNNMIQSLPSIPEKIKDGQLNLELVNNGIQELSINFEQFKKLDLRGNPICDTPKDYKEWYENLVQKYIESRHLLRVKEYKYELLNVALHPSRIESFMDIESINNII